MSAAAARSKRMAGGERSRAILAASRDLFARQGFAATTTRQIARAAGVSEALVFRHFPDKPALYRALLAEKILEAERSLPFDASLEALDDEAFLVRMIEDVLRRVGADPSFLRLLLRSALEGHELAAEFHRARIEKFLALLERRVRRRYARLGRHGVDPPLAARAFHGMVFALLLARHIFREPRARKVAAGRWARTLARIFLHGIDAGIDSRGGGR